MTQRTKTKPEVAEGPDATVAQRALERLLQTALPDVTVAGQSPAQLSAALTRAQEVWGFGLRHLRHEVRAEDGGALALYADRTRIGSVLDGPEALATTYASMQALDERGLSSWAVLPEGHRFTMEAGSRQLRVLIEDGRDFESHWSPLSGGVHLRTGRQGQDLWVEVARPTSGRDLVQDAAWEVVERIKDRALRRELQRRAEERGILGAVLSARSGEIEAAMRQSPSLHFTVSAAVAHTTERSLDSWRQLQKDALAALTTAQAAQVDRLVGMLGGSGRPR
ncbi:DNA repair protein [Deinococcus sonorensis]|uniref:DNA repair protein n=2 Tax=Deinococcus sonorensis TaxID=309891 RepID=A0AAU7U559_9DEIO